MDRGGGYYIVGREERHAPLEAIRVRDGCPWWMVEWVRATDCELRRMSMNRFGLLTANHPSSRMTDGGGADNVRISNIVRPQPLFTPPRRGHPGNNGTQAWVLCGPEHIAVGTLCFVHHCALRRSRNNKPSNMFNALNSNCR